jgi:hypothetical protein
MPTNHATGSFADEPHLEQCNSYILRQLKAAKKPSVIYGLPAPGPAITISYQTGAGAHEIAESLAGLLQAGEQEGSVPWTAFDRHLVEKVLEEHHLPRTLAKFMPEDRRSYIQDVMEELVGLRPPSWAMVPLIAETVLHLVDAGHVILVGRGASFITARMPNVFHVRLIASSPGRIARLQKLNSLNAEEAARFVKSHFHVNVDDDLLYHLAINTDRIPEPGTAQLIADGARICFQSVSAREAKPPGEALVGRKQKQDL